MSVWQINNTWTNPVSGTYFADQWQAQYNLAGGGKINASQLDLAGSLVG